jgi:hypothetical protein
MTPQIKGLAEKQIMRNGQNNNKRMRGRNRKGGGGHHQNPLSRVYESNGQDVKIRGTASHIAEKYLQLARDAQSSGDTIATENYYQHAEHYFRLIAAAQEQLRQTQPYFQQQPGGDTRGNMAADDGYDDGDGDGDGDQPPMAGEPFAPREPQQFYPREQQHHQPQQYQPQHRQHQPQHQPQHQQPQPYQPRQQHVQPSHEGDVERLPSFITGGGQPQNQQPQQTGQGQNGALNGGNGQNGGQSGSNGQNGFDGAPDRFPLHRRRRRHRGPGGPREHSADHSGSESSGPPSEPSSNDE